MGRLLQMDSNCAMRIDFRSSTSLKEENPGQGTCKPYLTTRLAMQTLLQVSTFSDPLRSASPESPERPYVSWLWLYHRVLLLDFSSAH